MSLFQSLFDTQTLLIRVVRGVTLGATAAGVLLAATPDPAHPFTWKALGAAFMGGFISGALGSGQVNEPAK